MLLLVGYAGCGLLDSSWIYCGVFAGSMYLIPNMGCESNGSSECRSLCALRWI